MQDKKPYNELGQRHGRWEIHYDDKKNYGKLFYIEHWLNDVRVGYEENRWDFGQTEKKYNAC